MKSFKHVKGFTLLELLIVISIAAILMLVAAPSMVDMQKRGMVKGLSRDVVSAINYARGEAVSRNKLISMCPSSNGDTCASSSDWSNGWLIFIDDGAGAEYGNGEYAVGVDSELLQVYSNQGRAKLASFDADDSTSLSSLSWNFRGYSNDGSRSVLVVCEPDGDATFTRGVSIERSGRAMTSSDSDNNGVHNIAFDDGAGNVTATDLRCP